MIASQLQTFTHMFRNGYIDKEFLWNVAKLKGWSFCIVSIVLSKYLNNIFIYSQRMRNISEVDM